MDRPYFFEEQIAESDRHFTLSEATTRHCVQALRMRAGDSLHITNGKGLVFDGKLVETQKKSAVVVIEDVQDFGLPEKQNVIAVSPVKNPARFEWFLEKAAELGISEIVPLICNRTEKHHYKTERLHNIVVSAMLQSRQNRLCKLWSPTKFEVVLSAFEAHKKYIAHCISTAGKTEFATISNITRGILLIGPEGDFTPDEIEAAMRAGCTPVGLGPTRLRTETAALTGAVLFQQL